MDQSYHRGGMSRPMGAAVLAGVVAILLAVAVVIEWWAWRRPTVAGPVASGPALAPLDSNVASELLGLRRTSRFVTSICRDLRGGVWVGSQEAGVARFDPAGPAGGRWTYFSTRDGLGDDDAYAIACDPRGRTWVGHRNHGVSVFTGHRWQNYDVVAGADRKDSLAGPLGERVFAIRVCPTDGDVWIATNAGLTRYSQARDTWTDYTRADGLPSDQVATLAFDPAGNLYVGTLCDGIAMADAADHYSHWRTVTGTLALSKAESGPGLPTSQINDLMVADDGTVYAATPGGLAWSGDRGGSWRYLRGADWPDKLRQSADGPGTGAPPAGHTPLAEDWIEALSADGAGHVYLGYRSAGLARFTPTAGGAPGQLTVVSRATGPAVALPARMDDVRLTGTYGGSLVLGPSPTDMATAAPIQTADPPMPAGAAADLGALSRSVATLMSKPEPTDPTSEPMAVALDDDWRTEGAWVGRYGRYWCDLAALTTGSDEWDYHWGTAGKSITLQSQLGPHHTPNDGQRYWVATNYTTDPRGLEIPSIYFSSRLMKKLTTPQVNRRISNVNDNAEVYPVNWEGPDLHMKLSGLPSAPLVLSIYELNDDGHDGKNRWRDYTFEVRRGDDAGRPLAVGRANAFWGGVYKRFLVWGQGDVNVVLRRNYAHNAMYTAVMLDEPVERPTPYFPGEVAPAVDPSPAGAIADALRNGMVRDPRWWAINHRRFAVGLARWCAAQPGDSSALRRTALYYAGLHQACETLQDAGHLGTVRGIEQGMRWDGVTPNSNGNEPKLLGDYLRAHPDAGR
jgi:hypothetical protein